jgi:hypothetical protein
MSKGGKNLRAGAELYILFSINIIALKKIFDFSAG